MAVIDSDAGEIVIRVVYDGPPEAGKTTSVRALAGSLAQPTETPGEDAGGRTLWFDWMEYVGGRFEGCRIRCQIVSVPGQRELGERRRRLLEHADVVVFVGDSSTAAYPQTIEYLLELRTILAARVGGGVGVGVVLQANKRDLPDAVPLAAMRERLGEARWDVGVVESVAADGTGIREAFVYAVRLALDRVRELMSRRELAEGAGARTGAEDLLAALRAGGDPGARDAVVVERGPASLAAELLREVMSCEQRSVDPLAEPRLVTTGAPRPPDASVPSGAIWPPVEGRAILHDMATTPLAPRSLSNGGWAAGLGSGWRVVTGPAATFPSLDEGRAALIQWARLHAASAHAISAHRCIVLAADDARGWRLWQIVRAEDSLRHVVEAALREPRCEVLIERLCQVAQQLLDADRQLARAPVSLPCNLDTIGPAETRPVYIGMMPEDGGGAPAPRLEVDAARLLRTQLAPMVAADVAERRGDLGRALASLPRSFQHAETIVPTLAAMLADGA